MHIGRVAIRYFISRRITRTTLPASFPYMVAQRYEQQGNRSHALLPIDEHPASKSCVAILGRYINNCTKEVLPIITTL